MNSVPTYQEIKDKLIQMDIVLNKKIDDQQSRHDEEQAQLKAEILSLEAENLELGQKLKTLEGDMNRLDQLEQKFDNDIEHLNDRDNTEYHSHRRRRRHHSQCN